MKALRGKQQIWWLSFVDPDAPAGQSFLGVCVVRIPDVAYQKKGQNTAIGRAAKEAWRKRCNPGGAVDGSRIYEDAEIFPRLIYNTLLSRAELELHELV